MNCKVYLAYHKPAPLFANDTFVPIHAGRAGREPFLGLTGDDSGDNISQKNQTYCELTALYWIWKNDKTSAFKGLMHYRRVLDFGNIRPTGKAEQSVGALHIPDWQNTADAWLEANLEDCDIVLPRLHQMGRSIEGNYAQAHDRADFDLARAAVAKFFPEYLNTFNEVVKVNEVRLGNIALMRSELFDRYCNWLFTILEHVEAGEVDRSRYNTYQQRYIGFLAERLFTVFVAHEQAVNPALRLRELTILNLAKSVVTPHSSGNALNTAGQVNIAFSADSAYLPHAAAMLRSLLDHADASRPLNLFFLHSGIKPAEMQVLEMMLAEHPNARLEPINVGNRFDKSYRSSSRAPSNATYNRFLLFDLLPDVEKLLYIDVDVIVRRDITALYDTEMGEAKVAAVTDWIMTRTLTGVFATADPDVPDLYKYQREKLGMQDHHIARYFNAGVVLFNFKAMGDLAKVSSDLMARVDAGGMLFRDQDILNAYFKDDLLMLDPRWNVFNSVVEAYGKVPASNFQTAMQARKDPWLIHYADGAYKPWRPVSVPMSEHYWQALIRTPFYGKVLAEQTQPRVERQLARKRSAVVKAGRALSEQVPILRKPLLKFYALVRHVTGR
ncbi:DUF4422 domain-containing protein [Lentibacter algarum]|uniref:DUF4422 domain-containing protein n=1 Tax=Lentibacter algarum TaxID=576131 RepID=UPI001C06BA78|nr:DUF4422 domain-containing protein [Lentibacter algarum]